jgi:uncharacterized protein YciI
MPLFVLMGSDGPRGLELRKTHRTAHLANLEPLVRDGRVRYAGPLVNAKGEPCGSLIVFEAESLEAARTFAEDDPYARQGIFERVQVWQTRQVFPSPDGTD